MNRSLMSFAFLCVTVAMFSPVAHGGAEIAARQSLTIQPEGPRAGDAGRKYFNVEGKDNSKFASFGVLVFDVPKDVADAKFKSLTLVLVQSVPKFSKDGAIKFFLAPDFDPQADLKFDPNAPDGVGTQIKALHGLGSDAFKKIETGKTVSYALMIDDTLRKRIAQGGKLCLVIVPGDATVAATYFGANDEDKEKSPKLVLELP